MCRAALLEGDEGGDGQDEEGEELGVGVVVVFGGHGGKWRWEGW